MLGVGGPREAIVPWVEGRRIHLLARGEIGERRLRAVEHAAACSADVGALEQALDRIFRHRIQRRLRGQTTDVWFELR